MFGLFPQHATAGSRRRPMTLKRWAGSLVLGAFCLGLSQGDAVADDLDIGKIELLGVKLNDRQARLHELFPRMFYQDDIYEDPQVQTEYRLFYGEPVVEQIIGLDQQTDEEKDTITNIRVHLTGEGRVFDLTVIQVDPATRCEPLFRKLIDKYGVPQLSEDPWYGEWLQRDYDFDQRYRVECFEGQRVRYQLLDRFTQVKYLVRVRDMLRPYVDEAIVTTRTNQK